MVIDRVEALKNAGDDETLLIKMVEKFIEVLPEHISKMKSAVESGDSEALYFTAHTLRGALATLGAKKAAEAALKLERMSRKRELGEIENGYQLFEKEIESVRHELLKLLKG